MPVMQAVRSSNVREVGYDAGQRDLYVRYKTGVYVYLDVPTNVWSTLQQVITAKGSVGTFVNTVIKSYECRKLHRLVSALEQCVSDEIRVQDAGGVQWVGDRAP